MTGVGPMFLAVSVLEILFGSMVALWQAKVKKKKKKGKKKKDLIGRGSIYFNVSGFLSF